MSNERNTMAKLPPLAFWFLDADPPLLGWSPPLESTSPHEQATLLLPFSSLQSKCASLFSQFLSHAFLSFRQNSVSQETVIERQATRSREMRKAAFILSDVLELKSYTSWKIMIIFGEGLVTTQVAVESCLGQLAKIVGRTNANQ